MWLRALLALAMAELPWQCPPSTTTAPPALAPAPVPPSPAIAPTTPKHEDLPTTRVTTSPPASPPRKAILLPEEVVVGALGTVRTSLARCFVRARTLDPTLGKLKIKLHLDIDEDGTVVAARVDDETRAATPKLATCLSYIARSIKFPAPGQPALADIPLMD